MSAPPLPLTSLGHLTCTHLLGPSSESSSSLVRFHGGGPRTSDVALGLGLSTAQASLHLGSFLQEAGQ